MNAKKCKAIRRGVRAQLQEAGVHAYCAYNPRKMVSVVRSGATVQVPGPITLSPECERFYFKSMKRTADPRWMKKVY